MAAAAAREHRELSPLSSDEEYSAAAAAAAADLRRGPWTVEEDMLLVNYIAAHGEGRWNALARCAGLRRTGKSCRLRWLNYLRPDLRRGNITAREQLLILELHSRWGNRWSKIAQHLPGRTDNEIKNYWRTRVQKHARQLNCDVNSQHFKDLMRYLWMPRLLERVNCSVSGDGDGDGDGDLFDAPAAHDDAATPTPMPTQQQQQVLTAWRADDVTTELSSCTTAASSSSASTGGMQQVQQQQQQQLVAVSPSPPPVVGSAAFAESNNDVPCYYYSSCHSSSNTAATMWDTLGQPPHSESDYQHPPTGSGTGTGTACCWSDESLLLPAAGLSGCGGVYGDMGFPDLSDTMWAAGAGADDLWYTQIMGL